MLITSFQDIEKMKITPISKSNPFRGGSFACVDSVDAHRIREVRRIVDRLRVLTDFIDDYDLRTLGSLLLARYGQRLGVKQITLKIHPRESEN